MKNNFYNSNDEEFQHVIKLLKELPKENAQSNFEYNLSVRIKNRNFDLNTAEKLSFFNWKIFVPATGAVIASVFAFLLYFGENDNFENPFQIQPQLRTEIKSDLLNAKNFLGSFGKNQKISENDVVIKENVLNTIQKQEASIDTQKDSNKEKIAANETAQTLFFPFDETKSTDIDAVLSRDKNNTKIDSRASLTGQNNKSSFFNGFFIREEVDKEYVEALKARMDSVKKELKLRQQTLK
jgi:hypothetical protein